MFALARVAVVVLVPFYHLGVTVAVPRKVDPRRDAILGVGTNIFEHTNVVITGSMKASS